MRTYVLTVFDQSSKKLLDESFTALNNEAAKDLGTARLIEEGYEDHTHRCVTSDGKLVLFHR